MKRMIEQELNTWASSSDHPVLLVRGARQVGKTFSIREMGKRFENILEVNFDEQEEVKTFFTATLSPEKIIENLSAYYGVSVVPGRTLLFFDEIQSCPNCLKSLRFFHEKMPQLHVVAAGSLLEFALSQIPSFGVGRIASLFMYPLSFMEFLEALDQVTLADTIRHASPQNPLDSVLHSKAVEYFKTYLIIGGMPQIIESYRKAHDLRHCQQLLDGLLMGFRDDFAKYRKKAPVQMLSEVFDSIALQAGCKFMYSRVNPGASQYEIKTAYDLLAKAGLVSSVLHTSASGLPLGAQVNIRRFKANLFDIGLYQRIVNLDLPSYLLLPAVEIVNKGAAAELFAGQEMIANGSPHLRGQLYYWHRESRNSNAEVDYVIQRNGHIIPVEVKSGTKGAMQSLFRFLESKNIARGVRLSLENFAVLDKIDVVPLYAAGNLTRE